MLNLYILLAYRLYNKGRAEWVKGENCDDSSNLLLAFLLIKVSTEDTANVLFPLQHVPGTLPVSEPETLV